MLGTKLLQSLLFQLSRPVYKGFTVPCAQWLLIVDGSPTFAPPMHPLHLHDGTVILEMSSQLSLQATRLFLIFNFLPNFNLILMCVLYTYAMPHGSCIKV